MRSSARRGSRSTAPAAWEVDRALASVLFEGGAIPPAWSDPAVTHFVLERIAYHGVAGLLAASPRFSEGCPASLAVEIRGRAVAGAMWELQHRVAVGDLLAAFDERGVKAVLLKGTAIAYDLYAEPAQRSRGDTDVLIAPADLAAARACLVSRGFAPFADKDLLPEAVRLQEPWMIRWADGQRHFVDLHWAVIHAHALGHLFPFEECTERARALPRVAASAEALDRPRMLLHACVHRQMHVRAPYFVGDSTYYGGDRLIWLHDLVLIAQSLSDADWAELGRLCRDKGLGTVCREGLARAYAAHGMTRPDRVEDLDSPSGPSVARTYLFASQSRRAWMDLQALPEVRRKFLYGWARAVPSSATMRAKYPRWRRVPVPFLHARRLLEWLLPRRVQGQE